MDGIFSLRSAEELLRKLEADFVRLKYNPRDESAAVDFFVTAESLLDWLHPGRSNKTAREAERNGSVLLQVTSHLATGVKHFTPEAKHHKSVNETRKTGGLFGARTFAANTFKANTFPKGNLIIELEGDAAQQLGSTIPAITLAALVVDHWRQRVTQH